MKFRETDVDGAYVIEPDAAQDERGFFARLFSAEEFAARGLVTAVVETSVAYNRRSGTLRGMHYQRPPHEEAKLVRCTHGAVYDVAVDLRPSSATHTRWAAVELSAENRFAFYVPPGCAHGYLTLTDDAELNYQISAAYKPESAAGVRWNDPAFAIAWPAQPTVISQRDAGYPDCA